MLGILNIWTKKQESSKTGTGSAEGEATAVAPFDGGSNVAPPFAAVISSSTSSGLKGLGLDSIAQDSVDAEGSSSPIGDVAVAPTTPTKAPANKLKKSSSKQQVKLSTNSPDLKIISIDSQPSITTSESKHDIIVDTPPMQGIGSDIGQTPARSKGKNSLRPKAKSNRISLRSINFVYPGRRKSGLATHQRESSQRLKAAEASKRETLLPQERISLRGSPHHPPPHASKAQNRAERRAQKSAVTLQRVIMGPTVDAPAVTGVNADTKKYHLKFLGKRAKQSGSASQVSKAQLEKVKRELMQPKRANEVIAHLRALPVPTPNGAATIVTTGASSTTSVASTLRPCGPIHAVCLAQTESEIDATHYRKIKPKTSTNGRLSPSKIASFASASLESILPLFENMHIIDLVAAPDLGLGQPGDGDGLLAGAVPTAETVLNGVMQITPQLMALGFATGRAILPDHKGMLTFRPFQISF